MQYKSNNGYTGLGQLGMLLLFLGLGLILASILQVFIGMQIVPKGTSLAAMGDAIIEAMKNPQNISVFRMLQIIGTLCALFIPALLYSVVCNGKSFFWLGFSRFVNVYQLVIGFLIIYGANMVAIPLEELSKKIILFIPSLDHLAQQLESTYNEQVIFLSQIKNWPDLIMSLIILAFFPAMFEEIFFRGAMQNLLSKWWQNPFWAIVVTSLLFSLIHGSVYLFLSRFVLGFVLGLMYHKTKNIWVNIIAHFLNNAVAVFQMFYLARSHQKISPDQLDTKVAPWLAIAGVGALVILFYFLDKYSSKEKIKIQQLEQSLTSTELNSNPFS
jgi:membrane protease YdiL (CAAX protease family)